MRPLPPFSTQPTQSKATRPPGHHAEAWASARRRWASSRPLRAPPRTIQTIPPQQRATCCNLESDLLVSAPAEVFATHLRWKPGARAARACRLTPRDAIRAGHRQVLDEVPSSDESVSRPLALRALPCPALPRPATCPGLPCPALLCTILPLSLCDNSNRLQHAARLAAGSLFERRPSDLR